MDTDPERCDTHRHRQTDRQTDTQTDIHRDDSIVPIADHTAWQRSAKTIEQINRPKT